MEITQEAKQAIDLVRSAEVKLLLERITAPDFGHSQDCCVQAKQLLKDRLAELEERIEDHRRFFPEL